MQKTITADACRALRAMIVSCGSQGCFETMRLLESVRSEVPYDSVAKIEGYGYRLKAFERLEDFADLHGITNIDVDVVAWYFGSTFHIDIMQKYAAHAGLAEFLGEAAGLVTHTLLPLNERGEYVNGGKICLEGVFWLNPDDEGTPFFHLGLVVRLKVREETTKRILEEQASSEIFMEYFGELPEVIRIPDNYYKALNCTAKK